MASLTGQSIASSYEQLLHVDRDGGGNSTTLVDIKDGDNGTTFALQVATDKIQVNGTCGIGVTPSDYFADYDNLVLGATSGSTGMTIVSGGSNNGTVAFADGTTGNAQYRGEFGFSHNNEFLFLNTAGSYRMVISAEASYLGMVGIGLTDPNSMLMVGSATGGDVSVASTDTTLVADDTLGSFMFKGKSDGGDHSYGIGAKIVAKCTETWNEATSEGTSLNFYTTDNGSATNDLRMIIDQNGEVFFGESAQGLSISGLTSGKGTITGINQALSAYKGLVFNALDHSFKISGTEQATIDSSGNLNLNERLTFSGTTTQATASINLNSNNYLYVTGGTSGLSLTAEGGADKIQIEDGGGSGRILFECTSTQVAKFDTTSRISLSNNDLGTSNTIFGKNAGVSLDDGSNYNTFIGENVSDGSMADATANVGVGWSSLSSITSGSQNSCIGTQAGQSITTGTGSVAIGNQALLTATTINSVISIGGDSMRNIPAGQAMTGVTAVGFGAFKGGSSTTTGANYTTAIGHQALFDLQTGGSNVAVGALCAENITTGAENTSVGTSAMRNSTTGSNNTAIGRQAMGSGITTGDKNTAVGQNSGLEITSGSDNVCLGYNSGNILTTGSENTILGYECDVASNDNTNNVVIGNNLTATDKDNAVFIGNDTNHIENDFNADATWNYSSDKRQKKDIKNDNLGLDFINDLRTVTYKHKSPSEFPKEWNAYNADDKKPMGGDKVIHGLIAQEVKEALDKHGVNTFGGWSIGDDGRQRISIEKMVMPLIKAVQELSAKVTELENK